MPEPIPLPMIAMSPEAFALEQLNEVLRLPIIDLNYQDALGRSAIHTTAFFGNVEGLRAILNRNEQLPEDRKVDINIRDHVQQATGLHIALGADNPEVALMLLVAGADPDATDAQGLTPRQYAERNGVTEALQVIDDHVAGRPVEIQPREEPDPDAEPPAENPAKRDALGRTMLHQACLYLRDRSVKVMVEGGADVNVREHTAGQTPVHLAAGSNGYIITLMLLEAGADGEAEDNNGLTPKQYAERTGAEAALQAFEDHASGRGAEVMREIGVYEEALRVRMEAVDAMEMEYEQRYGDDTEDWPELDEERLPPMPEPVDYPRPANMEEPNYRNGLGRLVLHMASLVGDQCTIEGLTPQLSAEEINAADFPYGSTPLMLTMGGNFENGTLALLDAGADITATDHAGLTATDYAERNQAATALRAARMHAADRAVAAPRVDGGIVPAPGADMG